MNLDDFLLTLKARGNWGHEGRPGHRGGSSSKGSTSLDIEETKKAIIRNLSSKFEAKPGSTTDSGVILKKGSFSEIKNYLNTSEITKFKNKHHDELISEDGSIGVKMKYHSAYPGQLIVEVTSDQGKIDLPSLTKSRGERIAEANRNNREAIRDYRRRKRGE